MLPNRALSDVDLRKYAKNIPDFRGVYMRDTLPRNGPLHTECGIINLDDSSNKGTHWVAYKKNGDTTVYFDSFGNLRPFKQFISYIGNIKEIYYNYQKYQNYNTFVCGHLCLRFLECNNVLSLNNE